MSFHVSLRVTISKRGAHHIFRAAQFLVCSKGLSEPFSRVQDSTVLRNTKPIYIDLTCEAIFLSFEGLEYVCTVMSFSNPTQPHCAF